MKVQNLVVLLALVAASSCIKSSSTSSSESSSSSSSTATGSGDGSNPTTPTDPNPPTDPAPTYPLSDYSDDCYGTGNEAGYADANQTIEYRKIGPIVAHGKYAGEVAWASTSMSSNDQEAFATNSRFNLRVIPKWHGKGTDSSGQVCKFDPIPWQKLKVGIRVRSKESVESGSNFGGELHSFEVKKECASKVHSFNVPNSAYAPVIEVLNVEWDYNCNVYKNSPHFDAGSTTYAAYCDYFTYGPNDCYELEVQVSTDSTKDLPGPNTNQ